MNGEDHASVSGATSLSQEAYGIHGLFLMLCKTGNANQRVRSAAPSTGFATSVAGGDGATRQDVSFPPSVCSVKIIGISMTRSTRATAATNTRNERFIIDRLQIAGLADNLRDLQRTFKLAGCRDATIFTALSFWHDYFDFLLSK
jgi:hypothetical protein